MSDKPILFSGERVIEILDGRKTHTRRIMKPQPTWKEKDGCWVWSPAKGEEWYNWLDGFDSQIGNLSPYGSFENEDVLWVRETWRTEVQYDLVSPRDIPKEAKLQWRADMRASHSDGVKFGRWRSSIHMPRWASRLTLHVVDIRVERVQDISLQDCIAEGMSAADERKARASFTGAAYQREWWRGLWDSINAKRGCSWESNSWVWVVQFELMGEGEDSGT
jgi:hypothetical protein